MVEILELNHPRLRRKKLKTNTKLSSRELMKKFYEQYTNDNVEVFGKRIDLGIERIGNKQHLIGHVWDIKLSYYREIINRITHIYISSISFSYKCGKK